MSARPAWLKRTNQHSRWEKCGKNESSLEGLEHQTAVETRRYSLLPFFGCDRYHVSERFESIRSPVGTSPKGSEQKLEDHFAEHTTTWQTARCVPTRLGS